MVLFQKRRIFWKMWALQLRMQVFDSLWVEGRSYLSSIEAETVRKCVQVHDDSTTTSSRSKALPTESRQSRYATAISSWGQLLGSLFILLEAVTRSSWPISSTLLASNSSVRPRTHTHTHTVDYHRQLLSTIVSRVSFPFGLRQATNESVVDTSRLPGMSKLTSPAQGSPAVVE